MSGDHPYRHLPDTAFWRRAVVRPGLATDPVGEGPGVRRSDRIATAGSCFAQNIARYLQKDGFGYLVTEPAHPLIPEALAHEAGYGLYSARYGNIYTSLQLLQLFDRAYGAFVPAEPAWETAEGGYADPFRPSIQPGGFASVAELEADRRHHFAQVRAMFETLDVLVFTLGLTETWVSAVDGAAFPVCPGVAAGMFDPSRHVFRNLRVGEVTAHMGAFLDRLRLVNPRARVILTVSPVPLAATAVPAGHVLTQTSYSKAVLRAAAQELADDHDHVSYFPSYEVITGAHAAGRYYADDLRTVTEEGVARVMSLFMAHFVAEEDRGLPPEAPTPEGPKNAADEAFPREVARWLDVMCDEAALDPDAPENGGGSPSAP